jgi:hypothetical protein
MLTYEDFTELMKELNGEDVSLKAVTLKGFWQLPSKDARVLPHLERLLDDKSPCLLGIPYIFGEIRWLAAQALTAERKTLGISRTVQLQNVVQPIYTRGIIQAAHAANIRVKAGIEGVLETFAILRDMDYLRTYNLILSPQQPSQKQERAQPIARRREGERASERNDNSRLSVSPTRRFADLPTRPLV